MRAFITSTGTDIGKTFVACALTHQLRVAGHTVRALKPVLSGFDANEIATSDAGQLLAAQGLPCDMAHVEMIAPYRFSAPLSPHMAAESEGTTLPYDEMIAWCRAQLASDTQHVLIEGVGGVAVPLDWDHTSIDWMRALNIPAMLVTGSYLGTLSHTITAAQSLVSAGIYLYAIIISESIDSTVNFNETARSIRHFIPHAKHVITLPRSSGWQDAKNMLELVL